MRDEDLHALLASGQPPAPNRLAELARQQRQMTHVRSSSEQGPTMPEALKQAGSWAVEHPLEALALGLSPVPFVGNAAGIAADAKTLYQDPESRTLPNVGMAVLGATIPGARYAVDAVKAISRPAAKALAKAAATTAGRSTNGSVAASEAGVDVADLLPMDEASRMQRAREMGFTVDAYHGTAKDFPAFGQTLDIGYHVGLTPNQANARARIYGSEGGGNVIPVKARAESTLNMPDLGGWYPVKVANYLERQKIAPKGFADKVWKAGGSPFDDSYADAEQREIMAHMVRDLLRKKGYDSIRYENVVEGPGDALILLDGAQIRSRFANFDPAKRDSADLLASAAPAAAVGGGAALAAGALAPGEAKAAPLDMSSDEAKAVLAAYVLGNTR